MEGRGGRRGWWERVSVLILRVEGREQQEKRVDERKDCHVRGTSIVPKDLQKRRRSSPKMNLLDLVCVSTQYLTSSSAAATIPTIR